MGSSRESTATIRCCHLTKLKGFRVAKKIDLSQPFHNLIRDSQREHPELHLVQALSKVNAPLNSYAAELGMTVDELTLIHICTGSEYLHPDLITHIEGLALTRAYKGQHRSRLKTLVSALLCEEQRDADGQTNFTALSEELPESLRCIWPLLPRHSSCLPISPCDGDWSESYLLYRSTLPLSPIGVCLILAILKVWNESSFIDVEELLEKNAGLVIDRIRHDSKSAQWSTARRGFYTVRERVRDQLEYAVIPPQPATLAVDELPEPLRTQVQLYQERARFGFKSGINIKVTARMKYDLELERHSEVTIKNYTLSICLGVGHIPRKMYGETLDIKDLLRLAPREIEIDEVIGSELYQPLLEDYRVRELCRSSLRKREGFDSRTFINYVWALLTVAAYNGCLGLRKQFIKDYKLLPDNKSGDQYKLEKIKMFDRVWLEGQIQRLRVRFNHIAAEGPFKSGEGGKLTKAARRDLNLCLFYVALVTLRYLGVRQQCVRDCVVGENIIFGARMAVTFEWTEDETKNAKGIRHRLSKQKHQEVLETLIEAVCTYHKKIYSYLSGSPGSNQPASLLEARRIAAAGQFYLKGTWSGLYVPFTSESDFYNWFREKAAAYLDFGDKFDEKILPLNPHLLRAMFGDWLRFDLKYSRGQTAQMAGDTEQVFEARYITHSPVYDATDAWTEKAEEIRAKKKSVRKRDGDMNADSAIRRVESQVTVMSRELLKISDSIDRLSKNKDGEPDNEE